MSSQQATSVISIGNVDAEIGRRVHQLLWDRHITQIAFGEMSGMDQTAVAKRLRGKLGWNATQVKRAAVALSTTVAYLYGETEDPHRPGFSSSMPVNADENF
ncbi:MAG TPA: helix-turn-helix transcriptional regulator [Gryllotalpicola sp.]